MPKRKAPAATRAHQATKTAVDAVRECADALFRAADECCHQHDRIASVLGKSVVEEELAAAQKMCELCDRTLLALAESYESTSAQVHPTGADEAWWRSANAVWLASRDFLRRHRGGDMASGQFKSHGPGRLGELYAGYELGASALLALRHAAEGYRQVRPAAT